MDVVSLLREQLDPELFRLVEISRAALPHLDGAAIASLLILYGIEIGLSSCDIGREEMADYLRRLGAHLDLGAAALPTLTTMAPADVAEPAF